MKSRRLSPLQREQSRKRKHMTLKVRMVPHKDDISSWESGISRVIEAYFKYLPQFDIELVDRNTSYDLVATHAGEGSIHTDIAHCHGVTKMDDRGNCCACGAPKGDKQ